jgi:hypothetical protein
MGGPRLRLPALAASEVERSPLRGRTIFVLDRSGDGAGAEVGAAMRRRADVGWVGSSGLFDEGVPRLLGNHLVSQGDGLGRLVTAEVLVAATRRLVDALLSAAAADGLVVDIAEGTIVDPEAIRTVYPDAVVVAIDDGHPGPADLTLTPGQVRASPEAAATTLAEAAGRAAEGATVPSSGSPPLQPRDALRDRLVLVFGVPRSGTTWLEQLLLAHSRTGGVEAVETWIFQAVLGFWRNHEGGLGLDRLVDRAALAAALRGLCDELFLHRLDQVPGATHFVEKTPGNAWLLGWINAVYPDAWYVHLVRDGRDVSRSAAEMDHGTGDVRTAARHWAATMREVDARRSAVARFREVRYEEVLADPVRQAEGLLRWVGLEVTDGDRASISAEAGVRVSRHGTTGDVGSGKWLTMRPAERRIVLASAGSELARRGYVSPSEARRARRQVLLPWGLLAEARRRLTAGRRAPA